MQVSVIINCCYEGLLLERSIKSAMLSIESSGFAHDCELIVVADNPTKTTSAVVDAFRQKIDRVVCTDVGDLGLARNLGVDAAKGSLILFLDGDDLWSSNWIHAAWNEFLLAPDHAILHPHYCVFFGGQSWVLVHPDWRDPNFDPRALAVRNCWTALCGVSRRLVSELPFAPIDRSKKFGYEDWSWYTETVARGLRHSRVSNTAHFIRIKHGQSLRQSIDGYHRIPSVEFAEYLAADSSKRPRNL